MAQLAGEPPTYNRHYRAQPASNAQVTVVPVMATGRALRITRLTIASETACTIYLGIGTGVGNDGSKIINGMALGAAEVWEGDGYIVPPGEGVFIVVNTGAPNCAINVFGIEMADG